MLRTTRIVLSTRPLIVSTWLRELLFRSRLQASRKIPQLDQYGGQGLTHFVVQFARERPALGFLRLHQSRREIFQLFARFGRRPILRLALAPARESCGC